MYVCGFCGGRAVWSGGPERWDWGRWVHADDGERVKRSGPGDFVSEKHNHAGTIIGAYDLVEVAE